MKYKKIFLLMFLIISLFSIASAYACEVNNTTISAHDMKNNLEINEDNLINVDSLNESQKENFDNLSMSNDDASNLKEGIDSNASDVKKNITVDVTASAAIIVNSPVVFNADLNESVSGDVIFTINDANYTVTIVNSTVASYVYTPIDNTDISVSAIFLGNEEYNRNSSGTKIFEVNRIITSILVEAITPITYGNDTKIVFKMNVAINTTVKLEIDGKPYYVALIGGIGNFNAHGLAAGDHNVVVVFNGDNIYDRCENDTVFTVDKANLTANVIALNVSVGQNTSFAINVPYDFKGNVSVTVDGIEVYDGNVKTLINGAELLAGNKTATLVFYGDDNYNNLTLNDICFNVLKVAPVMDINIDDATYPCPVKAIIKIDNNATGIVNITVNNKIFTGNVSNGIATILLNGLSAGNKIAKVEFISGDDYNTDVATDYKFTIFPNNSLITFNNLDSFYNVGKDIEIKISTVNSTGDLNIYINGNYRQHFYHDGTDYVMNIDDLNEGSYVISAVLDGDENYTGFSTYTTLIVVKNNIMVEIENLSSIIVDSPITITAFLNETVTGVVIFNINNVNYTTYISNSNVATLEYTPINNATLNVIAQFMGNDEYNENVSAIKQFEVNKIPTNVEISFTSSISAGDDVIVFVSMDPGIDCIVTLGIKGMNQLYKSYDVAVVGGSGIYTINNLANDIYEIEAIFDGDDRYESNTSETKTLFVNNVFTNLSISLNRNLINYQEDVFVNVVLNQSINAIVTIKVNGSNYTAGLVNGKANFTLNKLNKGNYIINAVFAGDDKYVTSISNTVTLNVTGDEIPSSTEITLDKYSAFVDEKINIAIKLNSTIDGVVKLIIGSESYNVVVSKGVGTFTISNLPNGTYDVKAIFEGNNIYSASSSDVKRLQINKIPTDISVSLDNSSALVGDNVDVRISLNPNVTGVVRLIVGSDYYNVVVSKGVGTFTISNLANGSYDVKAVFDGDDKYLANFSDVKHLQINKIFTDLSVNLDNSSVFVGDNIVVSIVLNQNINNVVTVTVDNKKYIVSIFDGKGNLTLSNLISGNYSVNAIFAGDDKYSGSFDVKHIEVNKIPTDLSISLVNSSLFAGDSAVIDIVLNQSVNGIVTVNVNDKNYTAVIVHGKGNLTLNNLTLGNYSVNAVFAGDEKYLGSSSNNMIFGVDKLNTSLFADSITVTYNINENLIITLKDSKGNAVSGVNVTVNLNGAKTLTTDNNGQIKVSTNDLTPNIYNAKITFNGSEIYDKSFAEVKVTVKKATPKIIASAKTFKLKTKTKKYSITLKDNINNVIKNARVILKIKGKTYQATTNSKGVATFKLKLNKKGTYTAVITYNGNNFYNKVSANAKIKVK